MELELNRTHVSGYDAVLDATVFQEETLETIVPDANPDIQRLVDVQGKALLKSKTASEGRAALTGSARLSVLYEPEGGAGPPPRGGSLPGTIMGEGKNLKPGGPRCALVRVAGADARMMNPRKIVVRVELAAQVRGYAASGVTLCTGAQADGLEVEQLKQAHTPCCTAAVQEKQITLEDELTLPAGRPAAEELLHGRAELLCQETRIIGSKLIVKGEAALRLLYRPAGGGVDCAEFTLPFSAVAELSGAGEEGRCESQAALTGMEYVLGADGRTVSMSLSMLAQTVVQEERRVELLSDLYSVDAQVQAERTPYIYQTLCQEDTGRQAVQQVIESGLQIQSVADAYCLVGALRQSREGQQVRLAAELSVTALCVTEDGDCTAVSRRMEASCVLDVPPDCSCRCSCRCGNVVATPTASGVEVRFSVDFPFQSMRQSQAMVVRDVGVEPLEPSQERPSIVLRAVGAQESLWDVAKQFGAAIGDIRQANELGEEQPWEGQMLLIPRKR
ncbi:MAG: DUF3794 domain-containing protein [Oscillospiraceae bacterium]|nr:DUF3794 domain-containing protein [Oscillospiraceae bacterium]